MAETAVIVAEFYRRNQEWKLRAVGQGFVGGLGPLARSYGVDVADDPEAEPPAPIPTPTPVPAPARPVRLEKITLEKKGQSISLEKKGQGFGEIVVNLNWSSGGAATQGGFFSRLKGSQRIDLDLGCLVRLQSGQAGAVQALGNSFGSLTEPPYIQLMGDDRSGDSARGEFLHINGRHWDKIERVLVFAFIYEGVPNWAAADAVVTLSTPGQPTLEVRLDSHSSDQGMCAIALLENRSGSIHVSKLVEYFRSHKPMDQAYGFGLRWAAGAKD
jgi:tellurite resistance protein TerA